MAVVHYLDSSVVLSYLLSQGDVEHLEQVLDHAYDEGRVASSRLLKLECERVAFRCSLDMGVVAQAIESIDLVRISDELIDQAGIIREHIRSLGAIHVATCAMVGATMVTRDAQMATVSEKLGITTILVG